MTVIEVAQLERLGDIQGRADLALSRREIVIEGNSVRGVVHNIGSAPAEAVVAALAADGKVIAKLALGMLEAPLDLKPRTAAFVLDAPRCARIVVDLEDAVAEIYEANNSVTLDAKATHP